MNATARSIVIRNAHANGWTTCRGYSSDPDAHPGNGWSGERGGDRINLEFSSKGVITWAWHTPRGDRQGNRIVAPDRLGKVLAILTDKPVPERVPVDAPLMKREPKPTTGKTDFKMRHVSRLEHHRICLMPWTVSNAAHYCRLPAGHPVGGKKGHECTCGAVNYEGNTP